MKYSVVPVEFEGVAPGEAPPRALWLRARKSGIGGSEIAAIMGYDDDRDAYAVWQDKRSTTWVDDADGPLLRKGRALEAHARREFELTSGLQCEVMPMMRSTLHNFMILNVDSRILLDAKRYPEYNTDGVLEIKCPKISTLLKHRRKGLPAKYQMQLQWYLAGLGWEWGTFCIFDADNWSPVTFTVRRDGEMIRMMLDSAEQFWRKHVLEGAEPNLPVPEKAIEDLNHDEKKQSMLLLPEHQPLVSEFMETRELITEAKTLHDNAKKQLAAAMGTFAIAEGYGFRFYNRPTKGKRTFQTKFAQSMTYLDETKFQVAIDEHFPEAGKPSQKKVRRVLAALLDNCRIDLKGEQFYKVGQGSVKFNAYRLAKSKEGEDEKQESDENE